MISFAKSSAALTLHCRWFLLNDVKHDDLDLRVGEPPPLPAEATQHYPIHPLFPLPEGVRETKEIHEISFDRWNDRGVKERCPDRFPASDLTSLAQVVEQFGGGTYQFIAFDSRGNFSRWTPEREKVRINLRSKPFRQIERVEAPRESQPSRPSQPMPEQNEYLALLVQQMTAAHERADRLMTVLLERLANPCGARAPQPVSPQSPSSQPHSQQHPQPQVPDTMAMLMGLATVIEKLRPAQGGDMMGQLSGLASIIKQLNGLAAPEALADDVALRPLLKRVTNAAQQSPAVAAPPAAAHQAAPAPRQQPDMVWVLLPEIGPVMMRIDQAARALTRMPPSPVPRAPVIATTAAPAVPMSSEAAAMSAPLVETPAVVWPTAPAPDPAVWAPAPAPSSPPAPESPRLPPSSAVSLVPSPSGSSTVVPGTSPPTSSSPPTTSSVAVSPSALPTPSPALTPYPPAATPAPSPAPAPGPRTPIATAAPSFAPAAERCIVCAELGRRDPAHANVLLCPGGHRSLLASPVVAPNSPPPAYMSLDDLPTSISCADIDAILSDPAILQTLSPEMTAALREVRAQMGSAMIPSPCN